MRVILLATCLAASACTNSSLSAQWEDVLPGTVLVIDAPKTAFDATVGGGTRTPHVADAVLENGVIYASTGIGISGVFGGPGPNVRISRDRGATWDEHPFPQPQFNSAPGTASTFFGLHVVNGMATATARGRRVLDLDLSSNTYASAEDDRDHVAGGGPLRAAANTLSTLTVTGIGFHEYFSFDVATRTTTRRVLENSGMCPHSERLDGHTFVGWCTADANTGGLCRTTIQPSTETQAKVECIADAYLPEGLGQVYGPFVTERGVLGVAKVDERTVAMDLVDGRLVLFDLGPGTPEGPWYAQPTFGNFLSLAMEEKPFRLVEVTKDGTVNEIVVPRSPCAHDDRCGSSTELVFLLPLGAERYGAFWRVDQGEVTGEGSPPYGMGTIVSNHMRLYYREIGVTRQPLASALPPPGPGKFPRYPEAIEATDVEKHCQMARVCWAKWGRRVLAPQDLNTCEEHWSHLRRPVGAPDPALAKFLSTPLGDCDALGVNWPLLGAFGQAGCASPACFGTIAVNGCANILGTGLLVNNAVDCGENGGTCRVSSGRAVCDPPPSTGTDLCASCTSYPCCVGTVACGDLSLPAEECAASAEVCTATYGCKPDRTSEQCATGGFQHCVDGHSFRCVDGRLHYLDCAEIGGVCGTQGCVTAP